MNWIVRMLIVVVVLAGLQPVMPAAAMVERAGAVTSHHDHAKMLALIDNGENQKQIPCHAKAALCCWQAHCLAAGDMLSETRMNLNSLAFLPPADTRLAGLPVTPLKEPPRPCVD